MEKTKQEKNADYCRTYYYANKAGKIAEYYARTRGTVEQARAHIEKQFEPWMSWENHGLRGWHIDHVKPLSAFDLNDVAQVKKAFHYTNLRPLHWRENISKSAKRLT